MSYIYIESGKGVVKGCVHVIFHPPILFKDMVYPLIEENTKGFRCLNYEGAQVLQIIHANKIYIIFKYY